MVLHVVKICITFIFICYTVLYLEGRSYANITMVHTFLLIQIFAYMIAISCHSFLLITTWFSWADRHSKITYLSRRCSGKTSVYSTLSRSHFVKFHWICCYCYCMHVHTWNTESIDKRWSYLSWNNSNKGWTRLVEYVILSIAYVLI